MMRDVLREPFIVTRKIFRRLAPLALFAVAAVANAELYKWVGPDGKVRYSDTPPATGAKPQTLRVPHDAPPVPPPPNPEVEKLKKSEQEAQAKRQAEQEAESQQKARAEAQKQRCDKALAEVKAAEDAPARVWFGPDGRENNFADRNSRINAAKAAARGACQGVIKLN